jgi:uncharacterized membrane protein YeiB
VIGLVHSYLLWYGDMLVPLALCGAVAFFAWRASPVWLFALGGAALITAPALSWWLTSSALQGDPAVIAAWRAQWAPRPEVIWLGLLLVSLGLRHAIRTQWDLVEFALVSQQLQYWGDILVAIGMVAVVMLLCQHGWRLRPLAAVGRMALTNYLLQTVICTTIFYGHGFGMFGHIDRAGQLAIVIGIWIFELAASSVWLRYFSTGPVERLVRGVVFGGRSRRYAEPIEPTPAPARVAASR